MNNIENMPNNEHYHFEILPTGLYDTHVKRFFTLKVIIAYLLKECVQEYADFTINEIIDHLNKEHKDTGSYIAPSNNEFDDVKGRKLNMDIVFHTVVPNTEKLIPIIINLEPQARYNPGYPLISRGIIYASRLLSLQEQGKTIEEFYNKIHKVYSIWICYNAKGSQENTIRCAEFTERVVYGKEKLFNPMDLDLAQVWVVSLGDYEMVKPGSLLRLLDVAFDKDHNMTKAEKMQFFNREYNIQDNLVAKEVEAMNAYVLDYTERAVTRARAEERDRALKLGKDEQAKTTVLAMYKLGMSINIIAQCVGRDEDTVKEWLKGANS